MMKSVPETAEHEAGGRPKEADPAVGTGAAPSEPPRGARRRAGFLVAGVAGVAVLVVAAVAIALATRGRQPATAIGELAGNQPVVTIVPQPAPTPAPQPSPSATPIPTALRQEIEDAYDRYWRVRADSAFRLDASRLPEVAAGTALERERAETAQLQAEGRAARIVVDLHFRIVRASDTSATIYDDVENRSYFIDAVTKEPLGPPPTTAQIYKMSYELEKIGGIWRVVDATRFPS